MKWKNITAALLAGCLMMASNSLFAGSPEMSHSTYGDGYFSNNEVSLGIYDSAWDVDIPTPPSPFFWNARQKVSYGGMLTYLHLLYHKNTYFTIYGGGSVTRWSARGDNLYTISALLEFRLWLNFNPSLHAYLLYSVAAPTLMSDNRFAGAVFTANFLFQDMLGVGVQFGQNRAFNFEAVIVHYSNGDILPKNSGIEVPLMFNLGYSFP